MGRWEPIPATIRQDVHQADMSPAHHRADRHKQPGTLTLTPGVNLESSNQPNMHVSGRWGEAGVPEDNPHMQGENMRTQK